jgi:hypothetical protein
MLASSPLACLLRRLVDEVRQRVACLVTFAVQEAAALDVEGQRLAHIAATRMAVSRELAKAAPLACIRALTPGTRLRPGRRRRGWRTGACPGAQCGSASTSSVRWSCAALGVAHVACVRHPHRPTDQQSDVRVSRRVVRAHQRGVRPRPSSWSPHAPPCTAGRPGSRAARPRRAARRPCCPGL